MGGPLSLRGFDNAGTGSRAYSHNTATSSDDVAVPSGAQASLGDSLGGDTKTSLLACLSVPVPHPTLASTGARAFLFANLGSLGNSSYWSNGTAANAAAASNSFVPSFGALRASVGGGLSFSFNDQVRLETTYSVP